MAGEQNWREETDAGTYFGHQKKTLSIADRRPVIRKTSDLVGPGIGASAVLVTDYNDILATFNGYYYSERAKNGPRPETAGVDLGFDTNPYVGEVTMSGPLGGTQSLTDLDTGDEYTRIFRKAPLDPNTITWGPWRPRYRINPSIQATINYRTTSIPASDTALLKAPEIEGVNWQGTYESTYASSGTVVYVNTQGVYTGFVDVRTGAAGIDLSIAFPSFLTSGSATFAVTSLSPRVQRIPLTFINTKTSPAEISLTATNLATGSGQSVYWVGLSLTRVGDAA